MASNSILAKMAVIIGAQTADFNKALSQSSSQLRGFESLTKTINRGFAAFGVGFSAAAIVSGIKSVVSILSQFESTMSEVRAITGATGEEFEALRKNALDLGSSTKFTAAEVGQLQVAYGRLGFSTKEILAATGATLDLAAATGEDLAKSADVAGSTVRGFGLNAKETQRVVDVMAASFNRTALGLENFTEAMKFVAPIAAAANVSVEETTALLGVLADNGIRGSNAGTALRKIFGDLSRDGRPVQERLAELGKQGISLSDSFDEVGRTAQTALLVLTKNTDRSNELASSFKNVSGEAARMARIMSDNLTGDVTKLTSAWEGLLLKLGKTDVIRGAAQALTAVLDAISGSSTPDLGFLAKAIQANIDQAGLDTFIKKFQEFRQEAGKPFDTTIVEELAAKYKLTSEQAGRLFQSVLKINEALSFQEKALQQFNEFAERNGYTDLSKAVEDYKQRLYELILAEEIKKSGFEKTAAANKQADLAVTASIVKSIEQISAYRRVIGIINEYSETLTKAEKVNEVVVDNLKLHKETLEKLNKQFDETDRHNLSQLRILSAQIAGQKELIAGLEHLKSLGGFETILKAPDTSALKGTVKDLGTGLSSFDQVINRFESGMARLRLATVNTTREIKAQFIDLAPAISHSITALADGLGDAISGVGTFGDAIIKAVAGFAKQLGTALIGIGTAMIAAKLLIKSPYTAIAAGVALVALAGALSAATGSAQRNFNSGGSGGVASSNSSNVVSSVTSGQIALIPQGEWKIQGRDLVFIYDKNKALDGSRRP
jgi:hypothetical protein